jgi:hypothetical protein
MILTNRIVDLYFCAIEFSRKKNKKQIEIIDLSTLDRSDYISINLTQHRFVSIKNDAFQGHHSVVALLSFFSIYNS